MMEMPRAVAYTLHEGGEWFPFIVGQNHLRGELHKRVHSIKFANGMEWDTYSGWREQKETPTNA